MSISSVEEVQGLYGPFSLSEKIIQKIWMKGDFYQKDLRTSSRKCLKILDPGRWNTSEGPDFREARLEIDGNELVGDVEIHFHAADWFNHGHDRNPNFSRVILHVVLYAPSSDGADCEIPIESLVLLPLLERDLEEYAMEAALLDLEQVNELEWFGRFMAKPLDARWSLLEKLAAARWQQKSNFALKRLNRANWAECCHHSVLEVMGYARNRSTMHKVAAHHSTSDFAAGLDCEKVFQAYRDEWKLSGCRPANHPKLRLQQYVQICKANPDWPEHLRRTLKNAPTVDLEETTAFRREAQAKSLLDDISGNVFQGVIGSKRLNTLLCDAIFPLAQAQLGAAWQAYWHHWYPGDYPDALSRFYRQAGLADSRVPMANGIMQGILVLFATRGEVLES